MDPRCLIFKEEAWAAFRDERSVFAKSLKRCGSILS